MIHVPGFTVIIQSKFHKAIAINYFRHVTNSYFYIHLFNAICHRSEERTFKITDFILISKHY